MTDKSQIELELQVKDDKFEDYPADWAGEGDDKLLFRNVIMMMTIFKTIFI